ncbi:MAG TPA: von Willebrand factor type A domain-containing protein [Tepidisphaeraceae bacterium]|jgi:Ca-activated chloride channel family protein|nr:von Willebrand factor type A domain-containing protein [Tepidisphaeraceae bacterium]
MAPLIDETSLTAYALGELSGAERAAVAAHLVGNATARQYVADIRSTAHLLADELSRESFGGLTDLQHAAIEQKLHSAMRISSARPRLSRVARWNRAVFAMSLAASVMIVCGVVSVVIPFVNRHTDVAKETPATHPPQASQNPVMPVMPTPALIPSDRFADGDGIDAGGEPQYVPPPDNELAGRGSGHEMSAKPPELIGAHAPETVLPTPTAPPAVARGSNDIAVPPAPANNNHKVPPAPKPAPQDRFADVPTNAMAPNKVQTHVGTSANGKLPSGEQYAHLLENPFMDTAHDPVSGFSAGVDTASYSNIRRFLTHGALPPRDAVRIEEMLNYFPVSQAALPPGNGPLVLQVELGACPWRPERRLARVCLQSRELPPASRPPVNLVFVIDISDAMRHEKTKLPLIKRAIRQLVGELTVSDRVALVAYAHEADVILPPTAADAKDDIWNALDRLEFAPQSRGGQGIEVAYDMASRNVSRGGVNRVILATDGNWNIGATDHANLASVIADRSKKNISLTVLGVGMDNLKDDTLQKLASAGNGSYAYIDTLAEARKVLNDQINGALVTVARDVKVQVTFNPASANSYRLLGYERRALSKDQLSSQSQPGGEMGAGQSVTALYEVIPVSGKSATTRPIDIMTATATYTDPSSTVRDSISAVGEDHATPLPRTSSEFRFAAAVAEFGLLLRDSNHKGNATYASVLDHAHESNFGADEMGYRREFLTLIQKAKALDARAKQRE